MLERHKLGELQVERALLHPAQPLAPGSVPPLLPGGCPQEAESAQRCLSGSSRSPRLPVTVFWHPRPPPHYFGLLSVGVGGEAPGSACAGTRWAGRGPRGCPAAGEASHDLSPAPVWWQGCTPPPRPGCPQPRCSLQGSQLRSACEGVPKPQPVPGPGGELHSAGQPRPPQRPAARPVLPGAAHCPGGVHGMQEPRGSR